MTSKFEDETISIRLVFCEPRSGVHIRGVVGALVDNRDGANVVDDKLQDNKGIVNNDNNPDNSLRYYL